MPRALPPQLQAAMDSGSFNAYLAIGRRTYTGSPPSALSGHETLITEILYYEFDGLELTVKYHSPNLPETDGLVVGQKYYFERGIVIGSTPHTIRSASLRFDDYVIYKQVITAYFSLFSPDEKPVTVQGDTSYQAVLTALNPNAARLGTVSFRDTPENGNHWNYNFYPEGKQVILKSYQSLSSLIRQKYLLQAVDNSDDDREDEIAFYHLGTPLPDRYWRVADNNAYGNDSVYVPSLEKVVTCSPFGGAIFNHTADGINWTNINAISRADAIAYSPELGMTVDIETVGSSRAFRSTNLANWFSESVPNKGWRSICWSPALGIFLAVGDIFNGMYLSSPDGINWTTGNLGVRAYKGVCWSPALGLFVAVGNEYITTSPDGETWTQRTTPAGVGDLNKIAWIPETEMFIALDRDDVVYSTDGINWSKATGPAVSFTWSKVAYSPALGLYAAVSQESTNNLALSTDGINWTTLTLADFNWSAIEWATHLDSFVITGQGASVLSLEGLTPDHVIEQGDVTLLKDGVVLSFLWRDELGSIHNTGEDTALVHNLGYLESTAAPPASFQNSDRASVTVGIHLKYRTGDIFTLQISESQSATYIAKVTEILDPNADIGWRCEIELVERFANTNAGALPSTIERVAAYTPLVTTNFDGNLDATVNNLQALADRVDDMVLIEAFTHRGAWDMYTYYAPNDLVSRSGSSYVCRVFHVNQQPPNATYWQLVASIGATGPAGPAGPTGSAGPQGEQGDPGTGANPSNDDPLPIGVASPGTSDAWSRSDHTHPGNASDIPLDTTNFDNNLDGAITDVQKLADAVDELTTSGGAGSPEFGMISAPTAYSTDFRNLPSALPAGWNWAGSPFVTPNIIQYELKRLYYRHTGGVSRTFLYRSLPTIPAGFNLFDYFVYLSGFLYSNNYFQGLRMDDGSDNNYFEYGMYRATTGSPIRWYYYHRTGGGTVASAEFTAYAMPIIPAYLWVSLAPRGIPWSNWSQRGQLVTDLIFQDTISSGKSWTPTRIGITQRRTTSEWDITYLVGDSFNFING